MPDFFWYQGVMKKRKTTEDTEFYTEFHGGWMEEYPYYFNLLILSSFIVFIISLI